MSTTQRIPVLQWETEEASASYSRQDHPNRPLVEEELADVLIYVVRLADVLEVDLHSAARSKMDRNRGRFPPQSPEEG